MTHAADSGPSPLPDIATITPAVIPDVLRAGLRDFLRAPVFGLFFSSVFVAGGVVLYLVFALGGQEWWLLPFVLGFPLLAPFATVGPYEVSRRIEAGEALDWGAVLGVVFSHKDRQLPSMAMVILLMFMFWVFFAHAIFALFMGLAPLTNITTSPGSVLLTGNGPLMLLVGAVIAVLPFTGMLPLFPGSIVVVPVLGHSTWHMYRRVTA
jgi:uncharacterized membrane protein